ncbi:hypothetical protein D922_01844 [Enterococcus faecalis 06-MB-DW-09]|nr:hypothetical protein D922_01844 [Enterococcus faecalis 06-MB-DW-09]
MNNATNIAINHINDAVKNDSLIVFVGAGVSANSGLPSWNDLIEELKKEILIDSNENDYLRIAQYYFDTVGQYRYYQKINSIFKDYINAAPNEIHDQILRLKPRHLITTNYDTLLEHKMNSGIIKYEVITQDSDIPYSRSDHYLIKMHGSLEIKNFVLKEEDYLDYENNFYMISTLIKSLIMNNTVLFIGYSLNDSTFNSIFRLIQKGFSGHARKAFFFTPFPSNSTVVEYYKNKGIQVINGDDTGEDLGKNTADFLCKIQNDPNRISLTSDELWDNISFLNNLSFVEAHDVASFAKLGKNVILYPDNTYKWRNNNENATKVSTNKKLVEFLNSKTSLQSFLDYERDNDQAISQNPVLAPAYELFLKKRYSEAKVKFREIANMSFEKKDYWNYLVSEFNVMHIKFDSQKESPLPQSSTGYEKLNKVIDSLILNGDDKTKQLCTYFRDEILSFRFIYRKLFKFDEFLDKFRNERSTYRNGGSSSNNNLWSLQYNFQSLINFVESNCITIQHYKEFLQIVNRYFECLLVAYDNSNYQPNENDFFGETSSIIKELTLENIKNIIPYLNKKNVTTLLDNYALSKIKISGDAKCYIVKEISSFLRVMKEQYSYYASEQMITYINFLSFVDDMDPSKIVSLLENFAIRKNNSDEIKKLLIILINEFDSLEENNYNKLFLIITQQLYDIIALNVNGTHRNNFYLYSYILNQIIKNNKELNISDKNLKDTFYLINNIENRLLEIEHFDKLLVNFYDLFDNELKRIVEKILRKYEKQDEKNLNLNFIIDIILADVYQFKNKRKYILQSIKITLEQKDNLTIQVFPNPKETAISNLYSLIQKKYFTIDQVKSVLNFESIKGIFPEVDWTLFKAYDDNTIEKLLKHRTFKEVREVFGKSKKERQILDSWIIKQAISEKVTFKKK